MCVLYTYIYIYIYTHAGQGLRQAPPGGRPELSSVQIASLENTVSSQVY